MLDNLQTHNPSKTCTGFYPLSCVYQIQKWVSHHKLEALYWKHFGVSCHDDHYCQFWSILVHFDGPHLQPHNPSMTCIDSYPLSSVYLIQKRSNSMIFSFVTKDDSLFHLFIAILLKQTIMKLSVVHFVFFVSKDSQIIPK